MSRAAAANGGWRAADGRENGERTMVIFLLLVIAAIALGIVGVVVKGLFYLLIIGIVVFLAGLLLLGVRLGRRRGKQPAR
jgi:hypothetical protein